MSRQDPYLLALAYVVDCFAEYVMPASYLPSE